MLKEEGFSGTVKLVWRSVGGGEMEGSHGIFLRGWGSLHQIFKKKILRP